ncbi:hypothetical protein KAFR_0D00190 [Kazachstania africana CBS 2517]|uniref:Uncharacterized protein n=1 Tax=Kazachstania africana (strain ATCC 22294 / BCRC 22015 / CBS 2517 / CECT 1963 / NBRC 1671 / NRRL Y-8276) TaxID=1071382 RepID=H2ATG5_KAZAF|nr:hypothetical protein KAFR_0D00190 [Kazachstania africana CBS 2517]CCF57665.1 hypothetical protein KAFR_0D00190 [Kazachstania africana CBS 2517]
MSSPLTDKDDEFHRKSITLEDILIDKLEGICTVFDNIYFLKNLGVIKEDNFIYKKLNKGNLGSKIWLVSLILSIRRCFKNLTHMYRTRRKYVTELSIVSKKRNQSSENGLVNGILKDKLLQSLQKCNSIIRDLLLEFLQVLLYLIIVIIEVFKVKSLERYVKGIRNLEILSNLITVTRIITATSP